MRVSQLGPVKGMLTKRGREALSSVIARAADGDACPAGELYPAWRWCEKQDAIEDALKALELKPALPDFYNILLERPRTDGAGYGLAFVDASRRANLGSSLSHSCNANCYTEVRGDLGVAFLPPPSRKAGLHLRYLRPRQVMTSL
jgi:hypothetical protein